MHKSNNNNTNNGFFRTIGSLVNTIASASVEAEAIEMIDDLISFAKSDIAPTVGKGFRTLTNIADATFTSVDNLVADWETYNKEETIKSKERNAAAKTLYSSDEYKALVQKRVRLELVEELRAEFSKEDVEELMKVL